MLNRMKQYWYRLSIRGKQLAFVTLLIGCSSLFSFYSFHTYRCFIGRFNANTTKFFNVSQLKKELLQNQKFITDFLKYNKLPDLNRYNENVSKVERRLHKIENEITSLNAYFLIRAIKNCWSSAYDKYNEAIQKRSIADLGYRTCEYKARRIYKYIFDYVDDLSEVSLLEGNNLYRRLMRDARLMQTVILGGNIIIIIFSIGFSIIFSNYLTKPITKLANLSVQMAEGDLNVKQLPVVALDEVGTLTEVFNIMSRNIQKMVGDLETKSLLERELHEEQIKNLSTEQLLKEARFLGLQAQINPHFLFNALNTISRVVLFGQNQDAIGLIEALSGLLRYNLGDYHKRVGLKRELEIIEAYLNIQKYRFGERLGFEIVCAAPQVLDTLIPPFTLQPLIENSIIHGLEPKEAGGKIRIRVFTRAQSIVVKIIDNGVGILPSRLRELATAKMSSEPHGHSNAIGIVNVVNRLLIFTGNPYCFRLQSSYGLGTVITIILPRKVDDGNV
jgi:two-component system sensor histidine kinase YesM